MRWKRGRRGLVFIKASRWPMPGPWCNALTIVPADEKADAALLEGIADWCDRFSPFVASLDAPDGLFLDITGAAHLFGGEAAMLATVTAKHRRPGLCRAGRHRRHIPGGACAGAFCARPYRGAGRRSAKPWRALPMAALECDDKIIARAAPRRPQDHRPGGGARSAANWRRGWAKPLSPGWKCCWARRTSRSIRAAPLPDLMAEQRFAEPIVTEEAIAASLLSLAQSSGRDSGTRGLRLRGCWKRLSSAPMARWRASRCALGEPSARCRR